MISPRLLLAVMLLVLVGWWTYPAGAQTMMIRPEPSIGQPGLWHQVGDAWTIKPSRDPCDGATVGTQDCSLETRVRAVLGISRGCDLPDLIAASREWAKITLPNVYEGVADLIGDYLTGHTTRSEMKAQLLPRVTAEARWRQALSACTP